MNARQRRNAKRKVKTAAKKNLLKELQAAGKTPFEIAEALRSSEGSNETKSI